MESLNMMNMEAELKFSKPGDDHQMTSSMVSASSSLTSPVDSGVQLLDSESEITSVMSVSGMGCDIDTMQNLERDDDSPKKVVSVMKSLEEPKPQVMTNSDIDNQNVQLSESTVSALQHEDFSKTIEKSRSEAFRCDKNWSDEVFDKTFMKNKTVEESDLMNVSLNSYELLDYTSQNTKIDVHESKIDPMHVSMSEEVSENLKTQNENLPACDEQIVYRRQRKKKSKSDTPKKRVSFHEDILNSTKIDDIHINHGLVTYEPDVSLSFFQRGFIRKSDVVKGRYSWAAEGDAPYYEKKVPDREIKSDIYIHHPRFSSSSSSSSASISSSIDEEDPVQFSDNVPKKEPSNKKPKSSCLKKSRRHKDYIDTNIVEEANLKKKESSLLDANIFGSLKNILSFSTSVPLAERGVPEGQEDITVYSTTEEASSLPNIRRSSTSDSLLMKTFEVTPAPVKKVGNLNLRTNLNFTKSEGFYPNYPNQVLPANIVICDSNVYEHKGISYSYEYDKFQKTFEKQNKPKSSTLYQMILKEFNFFKKKAKEPAQAQQQEELCKSPENDLKMGSCSEVEVKTPKSVNKYASNFKLDWSDVETVSDHTEATSSRHLNSPKHKIHKANHYSIQPFKSDASDSQSELESIKSLQNLKPASSKTSLINRFLRNVTLKKMLDMKVQKKQEFARKYMSLCVQGGEIDMNSEKKLVRGLEEEILKNRGVKGFGKQLNGSSLWYKLKTEIFRDANEQLLNVFNVRTAYTSNGSYRPLLAVLSSTTLYLAGLKATNTYVNHFVLPYIELNTIIIGPNSQTVHISNYDNDMQCFLTTGCANITGDFVGQLEIAMRKDLNKPKLPAVKQLGMQDMVNLRRAICKQSSVDKDEEYFYYSIVNIQDFNTDLPDTPLGPTKEGPLMFRISDSDCRWETAYFILKAGVLYMLSSPSHKVPMKVFPLINGACQGARRFYHYSRPHTFQIMVDGTVLYLAAPDEYVASDWLQALVHAASGTYNCQERMTAQSCSLLITGEHVLTIREALPCVMTSLFSSIEKHGPIKGPQVLSCASISDMTAFRLPSAEHSWCVLEFACREVHECSGDWILYFTSNAELERFISALEMLWAYHNEHGDCFPLSTIPETDNLNKKCMDIYNVLQKSKLHTDIGTF